MINNVICIFFLVDATGGRDLQGHPLVTLPSQRYPSLVQLNQADVLKLLKYLAFLSRFGHSFIIYLHVLCNIITITMIITIAIMITIMIIIIIFIMSVMYNLMAFFAMFHSVFKT